MLDAVSSYTINTTESALHVNRSVDLVWRACRRGKDFAAFFRKHPDKIMQGILRSGAFFSCHIGGIDRLGMRTCPQLTAAVKALVTVFQIHGYAKFSAQVPAWQDGFPKRVA